MIKDSNIKAISKLYKNLKVLYKKKANIQRFLDRKNFLNQTAIQLSYDLQSGSYIKKLRKYKKIDQKVFNIFNKILTDNFSNISSVLDFGSGELTRFMYVIDHLKKKKIKFFACDLSLNRLFLGKNFFKKKILRDKIDIEIFTIDNFRIPLPDNSIDVIITCHAIESNRKNMKKIIKELFRVSKFGLCLMEPHYEIANIQQKKRMDYYKYIKGVPKFLTKQNYDHKIIKKKFHINPNNPSSIFIIKKKYSKKISKLNFIDPINRKNLRKLKNFYYSNGSSRLYPAFDGITIFSNNSGIFLPKPE